MRWLSQGARTAVTALEPDPAELLAARLETRQARVGVIGLGYVGLPLAAAAARAGFRTTGFDIDPRKPVQLNAGQSYIDAVSDGELSRLVQQDRFRATDDFAELAECDVVAICVPTPLTRQREPDLSFVEATVRDRRPDAAPGTARRAGIDHLARHHARGGEAAAGGVRIAVGAGLLPGVFAGARGSGQRRVHDPVDPESRRRRRPRREPRRRGVLRLPSSSAWRWSRSTDTAEAVKITENVFRAVNIALVNELKMVFDRMGIDVWEVIEAAKTKPFGYMPFYPGPGLGGHCVPIDPFYLTWKSREFDMPDALHPELCRARSTPLPCRAMWSAGWRKPWARGAARR